MIRRDKCQRTRRAYLEYLVSQIPALRLLMGQGWLVVLGGRGVPRPYHRGDNGDSWDGDGQKRGLMQQLLTGQVRV